MQTQASTQRSLTIDELRDRLDVVVDEVAREGTRVLISNEGKPVAVVVPVKDLQGLRWLDQERAERTAILEAMRAPFRDVPLEEIERETEKAIAEVRAERRAERERDRTAAAS